MKLVQASPDTDWKAVQRLIAAEFAYMELRLGHPPRAAQVPADGLAREAQRGTCWLIMDKTEPRACLFTRPSRDHDDALYLGKLAVAKPARGKGLARQLVEAAANDARRSGYTALTLDTSDLLHELHATFARLGFGPPIPRTAEPGVVTMMRPL